MGNVCGSPSVKDSATTAVAEVKATNGTYAKPSSPTADAVEPADVSNRASTDTKAAQQDQKRFSQDAAYNCHSVQAVKGDTPASISIKVAPAPPPEEYPEIRAAVLAAQKEVKAGAKLKFTNLYTLGQVIGTGHYARWADTACCYGVGSVSPGGLGQLCWQALWLGESALLLVVYGTQLAGFTGA